MTTELADRQQSLLNGGNSERLIYQFAFGRPDELQMQIAKFLSSGGTTIIDPGGTANVFEIPTTDPNTLEQVDF